MIPSKYISLVAIGLLSFGFTDWQDKNSPPGVTISVPGKGNTFQWNSIVPYTIAVSDAEDGSTEYDEIQKQEVILVAKYFPDSMLVKKNPVGEQPVHHDAVLKMGKALCFTCHAAKTKVIGPPFEQVAARYKNSPDAVEPLARKIIDGSTGAWSDLRMPPHPDLKEQDVNEMVTWILNNSSDPNLAYFVGTEGALRTREKPLSASAAGVYVLTASYLDHGPRNSNNGPNTHGIRGQHTIVLRNLE